MRLYPALFALCLALPGLAAATERPSPGDDGTAAPHIATYSIVARDPRTGDYGVAVQSKYFSVGTVVPHAAAGVGALATQARGNLLYGAQGLELMAQGIPADQVIERLTGPDELRDDRQVGVVDRAGGAASYTGPGCLPWAGGRTGQHYAVQGNLLAGPQVVDAIATAFETTEGDFPARLVAALAAGQAAGGDARGRQSAALLVVREGGGYLGMTDRYVDLHVEDHPTPIRELGRLLEIRMAQLELKQAQKLVKQAGTADGAERTALLAEAAAAAEGALGGNPDDEYAWWTLARIRLAQGDTRAAGRAGRAALSANPTWRTLPPSTLTGLGVEPEMIEALQRDDAFRRTWDSLVPRTAP